MTNRWQVEYCCQVNKNDILGSADCIVHSFFFYDVSEGLLLECWSRCHIADCDFIGPSFESSEARFYDILHQPVTVMGLKKCISAILDTPP